MPLDKVTQVLDEVMAGRAIGEILWGEARREVHDLRAKLPILEDAISKREVVFLQTGETRDGKPGYDEITYQLGQCFELLERMIVDLTRLGVADQLSGDDADKIIRIRRMLERLNYEPVARRKNAPRLVFKAPTA
jgi:hypothetical protein